jgi:hypothetical protein
MTEETKETRGGTRLKSPRDLRRYMAKILCRLEKLPDKDLQEKAGQISKLGDTWLRAWKEELETERIRKLEWEIYELRTGQKHPEAIDRIEITEEITQ